MEKHQPVDATNYRECTGNYTSNYHYGNIEFTSFGHNHNLHETVHLCQQNERTYTNSGGGRSNPENQLSEEHRKVHCNKKQQSGYSPKEIEP